VLTDWRTVRSFHQLNLYREEFAGLTERKKKAILAEMAKGIADYKDLERELKPPQAEKPLTRPRRVRSRRS